MGIIILILHLLVLIIAAFVGYACWRESSDKIMGKLIKALIIILCIASFSYALRGIYVLFASGVL